MSEFIFNEHNTCINPNIYNVIDTESFKAEVKTAFTDGKWAYGYDYINMIDGFEGAGCLPSNLSNIKMFDTEEDVKRYVIKDIIMTHLVRFGNSHANRKDECDKLLSKCKEYILDTYQLSLF